MTVFLYTALLGMVFTILSIRVIALRGNPIFAFMAFNNRGETTLNRAIRGHGNFAEYTPIFLIILYFVETSGSASLTIHALGASFLIGRMMHGICFGVMEKSLVLRIGGTALTMTSLAAASILLLTHYLTN